MAQHVRTDAPAIDGALRAAVATCLLRMYSKPERVIACARALQNNSGAPLTGRALSQAFTAAAVSFQSGKTRSRRPLPMMCTLDMVWRSI